MSLFSYHLAGRRAACILSLATLASAGRQTLSGYSGLSQSASAEWNVPATASVFSEEKKAMPKGSTQAVELLRFVTAYKKGVEALVDITPYSALLRASADTDDDLTFYAFIDTWVGNNTPEVKPVMKLDKSGKCEASTQTKEAWGGGGEQGNGWQLDADLVFWPREGTVDTRPRESITVSSGFYGSYSIGGITTHEGKLGAGGSTIELRDGADFTGTVDAEVYPCPSGAKDVERGIKMGEIARRVHASKDSVDGLVEDVYQQLSGDMLTSLDVISSDSSKKVAQVKYNPAEMTLAPGMPVWYEKDDVLQEGEIGIFGKSTSIGKVVKTNGTVATVELTGSCFPSEKTHWLPRLKMEKAPNALHAARKGADSMKTLKKRMTQPPPESKDPEGFVSFIAQDRGHTSRLSQSVGVFTPFLVAQGKDNAYVPLPILGTIDLDFLSQDGSDAAPPVVGLLQTAAKDLKKFAAASTKKSAIAKASSSISQVAEGDNVCVLARRATGRVFERTFQMPSFIPGGAPGDRVLLQFAVTGHGWSGSTEQCGEFCHAIYHIKINGQSAANVTEWRDDCEKNPVSNQFGTWEIHRDGWCPGSVEPGLYIDATKWMKAGKNHISVDLNVWSSKSRKYDKYTNYGNYFGGGDGAVLFVGATFFIYDAEAADAIVKQNKPYTAAEMALMHGSSVPKALRPPEEVNSAFGASLLELSSGMEKKPLARAAWNHAAHRAYTVHKATTHNAKVSKHQDFLQPSRYNFEAKAPWYQYNEKSEGKPGAKAGAAVVPAFVDALVQINAREIRVKVKRKSLPEEWGSAAIHFRLEQPSLEGLEMDNWDRVGSLGLMFEENAASTKDPKSRVKLNPATELTSSHDGKKHKRLNTRWTSSSVTQLTALSQTSA